MSLSKRLELSHARQREEQHNLNNPPDHMSLSAEFGSIEGQVIDPHVEVGQRHGDHQKEEKPCSSSPGFGDGQADPKDDFERAAEQIPKGWRSKVRRHNGFEWFGIGPVQQANSTKGHPEDNGESVEK